MKIKKGKTTVPTSLALFIIIVSVVTISFTVMFGMQYLSGINFLMNRDLTTSTNNYNVSGSRVVFVHPKLEYTFSYPSDWRPQVYKSPAGLAVQPYTDYIIFSPDYVVKDTMDSSTILKGASIFIRGVEVPDKTIEDRFARNILAQKVASSVSRITIDGVPAIAYTYSNEGENATNTTLIKNGKWYLLKYEYGNQSDKDANQAVYQQVLDSFRAK